MSNEITTYNSNKATLLSSIQQLYKFRALIWVFARRDLKVKYAQTSLGYVWGIFKPLLSLTIYVFFFGYILDWTVASMPYAVYVLSGLLTWNFFSYVISNGTMAVHESSDLIKKIYFPKSVLVLSKLLAGLVELSITFSLLIPIIFYYQLSLSWNVLFVPVALLYSILLSLVFTFTLSAISVVKRDVLQVLPFLLSLGIWFTPVFITVDVFPAEIQFIFSQNPLALMIDLWRWSLFGTDVQLATVVFNFTIVFLLLVVGYHFYLSKENQFADRV